MGSDGEAGRQRGLGGRRLLRHGAKDVKQCGGVLSGLRCDPRVPEARRSLHSAGGLEVGGDAVDGKVESARRSVRAVLSAGDVSLAALEAQSKVGVDSARVERRV